MKFIALMALLLISSNVIAQDASDSGIASASQVCDAWLEYITSDEEQQAYESHCLVAPTNAPTPSDVEKSNEETLGTLFWVHNFATIRNEPSTAGGDTTVIRTAGRNEQLFVLGEESGEVPAGWRDNATWYIVQLDDGNTGYVYSALIAPFPAASTSSVSTGDPNDDECGPQRVGFCLRDLQRQYCLGTVFHNWFTHYWGDDHSVWLCRTDSVAIQLEFATGIVSERTRPSCGKRHLGQLPCEWYFPFNAPTFEVKDE